MTWELEGLIAKLLLSVACAGQEGLPISELLSLLTRYSVVALHLPEQRVGEPSRGIQEEEKYKDWSNHACSALWRWLADNEDISIGTARTLNCLSWNEVLDHLHNSDGEYQDHNQPQPQQNSTQNAALSLRQAKVYASDELMWACLTGHSIDYKRIPKSEWTLLLGIASTKDSGILQGDLGRLCDQDKRSVPKRTDALASKGYIVKSTTLVRGTKTSKIWLRAFAPSLLESETIEDDPTPELILTREILVDDLEPVPWHSCWTKDAIDFRAMATTIMAIAKEWSVIRMVDLKAKLGVLGSRWHMKNTSKVCRILARMGTIEYIAAKLDSKVFKDCIRFAREMNVADWNELLSTGKRNYRTWRLANLAANDWDEDNQAPGNHLYARKAITAPPWHVDQPLFATILKTTAVWERSVSSNPAIAAFTLGPAFNRFITSATAAMSTPDLQPPHLSYLQLTRVASERKAIFEYFSPAQNLPATSTQPTTSRSYGFSPPIVVPQITEAATPLAKLCRSQGPRKRRGRPRRRLINIHQAAGSIQERPTSNPEILANPEIPESIPEKRLLITLKLNQGLLVNSSKSEPVVSTGCDTSEKVNERPDVDPQNDDHRSLAINDNAICVQPRQDSRSVDPIGDSVGSETIPASENNAAPETGLMDFRDDSPKRGRGKGRGRGRGRGRRGLVGNSATSVSGTPKVDKLSLPPQTWSCSKCGGVWKNDIGLKYHVEKSRTACNPTYTTPSTPPPKAQPFNLLENKETSYIKQGATTRSSTQGGHQTSVAHVNTSAHEPSTTVPILRHVVKITEASSRSINFSSLSPECTARERWGLIKPDMLRHVDQAPISPSHQGSLASPSNKQGEISGPVEVVLGNSSSDAGPVYLPTIPRHEASTFTEPQPPDQDSANEFTSTPNAVRDTNQLKAEPRMTSLLSPNRKTHPNGDMTQIVLKTLAENQGCAIGGQSFLKQMSLGWISKFPQHAAPKLRVCKTQLQKMLKLDLLKEHWHGFRLPNGKYQQCQVITSPEIDPFHEKVLGLVEAFKSQKVADLQQTAVEIELKPSQHGRRDLPQEIATLDAPVYTAQTASGLNTDGDKSDDGLYVKTQTKSLKRGRKSERYEGTARPQNMVYQWVPTSQWARSDYTKPKGSAIHGQVPFSIHFLPPNAYLGEEPHVAMLGSPAPKRRAQNAGQSSMIYDEQPKDNVRFAEPTAIITGSDNAWPSLELDYFESLKGALTLTGWWPSKSWLSWESFPAEVDQKTRDIRVNHRLQFNDTPTPYQLFLERLIACRGAEILRIGLPDDTSEGPARPHNDFVNFSGYPTSLPLPDKDAIIWLPEDQLGIDCGSDRQREAAGKPILVSDDEHDIDLQLSLNFGVNDPSMQMSTGAGSGEPALRPKAKPITLKVRRLTPLNTTTQLVYRKSHAETGQVEQPFEPDRLLVAFVIVRVLLGGIDRSIDWGLLLKLFPHIGLPRLRRFWFTLRKSKKTQLKLITREFQDRVIEAFQDGKLPIINFDDIEGYDWDNLIDWALDVSNLARVDIPSSKVIMDQYFHKSEIMNVAEDWREKFFHPQTSTFTRFEDSASDAAAFALGSQKSPEYGFKLTQDAVVRSWIRSLCCTDQSRYPAEQVREQLSTLSNGTFDDTNKMLEVALDTLSQDRFIHYERRPTYGSRPYRLNEYSESVLQRAANRGKYLQAGKLKSALDDAFRRAELYTVPYNLDDGSTMALMNMNASGRIKIVSIGVPDIPYGFEPGNYEVRKHPKSYYRFDMQIRPTASYLYDERIEVLYSTQREPPKGGVMGEQPQWIDLFGHPLRRRWADILGAVCFLYSTRGCVSYEGVYAALRPVLEQFEIISILGWGRKAGILDMSVDGQVIIREWWWLAVARLHDEPA